MKQRLIVVYDLMQQDYAYLLTQPTGRNFPSEFLPELTPQERGSVEGEQAFPLNL